MDLPLNYIIDTIYRNCKRVKHSNRSIYNFECPVCNEGKSKNKRRRGYYFAKENYFYCQNCQKSWSPNNWIMEVENLSFKELLKEAKEYDNTFNDILFRQNTDVVAPKKNTSSLPYDSINLSDPIQLNYYKDNTLVQQCIRYINNRRLDTAINRPKTFYISLTDIIHKNRLCIPFYDTKDKIIYYQTRALLKKDEEIAKYLSKKDADKTLYGINNISSDLEYIFIFEGPIDSMFCKNGVGACGLTLTQHQSEQLNKYRLHQKIWVLDNQLDNSDVLEKYIELLEQGKTVFMWPKEFNSYKDMNDVCVVTGKNYIPPKFIINNSYSGLKGKIKLKELTGL